MAKIVSEAIVVSVKKLQKDDAPLEAFVPKEKIEELEEIATQLLGNGYVVEVSSIGCDTE